MGEIEGLRRTLEQCEQVVDRHLDEYVAVGMALMEIRDGRLYKKTHSSFVAYLNDKPEWKARGLDRRHANRLVAAAEVAEKVGSMDPTLTPANLRQARALAPLKDDSEAMVEVMSQVTEADEPVTAKAIAEAVSKKLQQVDDVTTELEAAREEVGRLNAMAPDDFDPALNSRLIAERGQLVRVCNELLGMGDPAELFDRQRAHLRESHSTAVSEASAWLSRLNQVMEDR